MLNQLNKYYTPDDLCVYTVNKTLELFPKITEWLEPSAGSGNFIPGLQRTGKPFQCFDLYPEHESVIEQDFLTLQLPYLKTRAIIGNPPFGASFNLGRAFVLHAAKLGGVVSFILPPNQYKKNLLFKNIKLVYSEMFPDVEFILPDGRLHKLPCCLNIYDTTTPEPVKTFPYCDQNFEIKKVQKSLNNFEGYDYYISSWGSLAGNIYETMKFEECFGIKIINPDFNRDLIEILNEKLKEYVSTRFYLSAKRLSIFEVKEVFNQVLTSLFNE